MKRTLLNLLKSKTKENEERTSISSLAPKTLTEEEDLKKWFSPLKSRTGL